MNKKGKAKFGLFISIRSRSDVIMVASALRRVGFDNWHTPYDGVNEIGYGFWDHPIKCIKLYFMLCRTCKVWFERRTY